MLLFAILLAMHPAPAGSEAAVISAFESSNPVPGGNDAPRCWRVLNWAGQQNAALGGSFGIRFHPLADYVREAEAINSAFGEAVRLIPREGEAGAEPSAAPARPGCTYGAVYRPLMHGQYAFVHAVLPMTAGIWEAYRLADGRGIKVAGAYAYVI